MKHFTVLLKAHITYKWAQETNSLNQTKGESEIFPRLGVQHLGILLLETRRKKASTAFSEAGNRILEFIFASDFRENIAARKHPMIAN